MDIDNPEYKNDSITLILSRCSLVIIFCFFIGSCMVCMIIGLIFMFGYIFVNISPSTFEYHSRNETLHNYNHYAEDGLLNIFYIFIFCLFSCFVYMGIIIPCSYWKKDLEQKEKDLELGNADL
jgi:ABC-type Fe3+ transport system permease subunit